MDSNGNGLLSLAEIDKGVRDLKLPMLFSIKPVILRAFVAAKDMQPGGNNDYVERSEYRHLLKYLRMYFEYWIAFDRIDADKDRRLSIEEFKKASETLKKWGIKTDNLDEQWAECDADGKGKVLFDEFCNWAIKKGLDLDDDDDVDEEIEKKTMKIVRSQKVIKRRKQSVQAPKIGDSNKDKDTAIWAELRDKLPWKQTEKHRHLRAIQFRKIDFNGNGYISLAELDKGLRDVIKLPALF